MKIGLIIHSVTGNTLSVAEKLQKALEDKGHETEIKQIKTAGKVEPFAKEAEFTELPDLEGYDALVFGSHTEAFQLEQAMKLYFDHVDSLNGYKVACLVTHQFPYKWLGGSGAVNKLKGICESKGAEIVGTAVVDWSPESKRPAKIADTAAFITSLFD